MRGKKARLLRKRAKWENKKSTPDFVLFARPHIVAGVDCATIERRFYQDLKRKYNEGTLHWR